MTEKSEQGSSPESSPESSSDSGPVLPSKPVIAVRGFTRRCPWCGDRKAYFTGWFRRQEECRECGRSFRRGDDAFELGAITVNMILTFLSILITILVMVVATVPNVPILWVTLAAMAWAVIGPILYYPVSFTIWQAVDLVMRGSRADGQDGRVHT